MSFFDMPISGAVEKIVKGELSCLEIVEKALGAIESKDQKLGSFISVQNEKALSRAQELDGLSAEKKRSLPLLGIPVGVKDNICTLGVETTCASRFLEGFIPPYNAAVVQSLERAGAVIVGKTNLDEFAMGSSTENSRYGVTKNPHSLEHIPGGSSGGSAAAVGADLVPATLGSDTGGSIRQPSSHCGVIGLKPTYGRVSRFGLVAFASSLDQIGPVAKDVRDVGLLLSVISEADKRDSTCAGKVFSNSPQHYNGAVDGLRIGIPKEYFGEGLSQGVREKIEGVVSSLQNMGATIVDISLPNLKYAIATYYIICTAEASSNLARYDGVKYGFRSKEQNSLDQMYMQTRKEGFGSEVKRRIMLGTYVLSSGYYDAYYLKAAKVRTLINRDFNEAFEKCDTIVSPVTPAPAFKIGEKSMDPLQMYLTDIYTVSANLAGIPAISFPCGTIEDLPVGVQFMAPQWREDLLLKTAYAAQVSTA
ncbi:Asp-tRNA(Asn)/Glu-tRNA(Gln) amidotransferase subunit GatA [Chitinispirillales bacterium ANBcel5]|uniref:Asp-tRNA(Asn)/Glu-tRNA(Gln) amidotransferase subunit GatA n=1 Tax=Cellulosispirillum alkaliphilum TaxID=3039283 RepID=UPI002A592A31|nr:Asp-tRNA(Asn)/Glu-tRNA(Gln) amidotransferase subunit GatA [Chitinispirillales bacterium ANBcel5]